VEVVRTFLSADSNSGTDAADDRLAARPSSRAPGFTGMKMFELGYRQKLVYVERVRKGSPAHVAGLKSDDLIVTVNGQLVRDLAEYRRWLAELNAGDTMQVVVKRAERLLEFSLVLEPAP
jgi:predicted metalloprotease with PDZ domain